MLILIVFLLILSGCMKNTESEVVESYKVTKEINETMSNAEQGIYMIYSSKDPLVIYRGVEKGIESMSYSIYDNVLTVHFETDLLNQPQDYVYKINSNSQFDTIQISIDGNSETIKNVFVQ